MERERRYNADRIRKYGLAVITVTTVDGRVSSKRVKGCHSCYEDWTAKQAAMYDAQQIARAGFWRDEDGLFVPPSQIESVRVTETQKPEPS